MKRARYISMLAMVCGGVLVAAVILFGIAEIRYAYQGQTVDATIEKLEAAVVRGQKSFIKRTVYIATYEFTLRGESTRRKGRGELSERRFGALRVGETLPIEVLPDQPTVNRPVDADSRSRLVLVALGALGVCLLAGGVVAGRRN